MIKKNTKIIFEDDENGTTDELIGGIPLTKGETIQVQKDGQTLQYQVMEKQVNFIFEGDDQTANITYVLSKQK